MFDKCSAVPVFLAGMWPSLPNIPESGTSVALIEHEGGPILLQGYSDELGEFRARLASTWVGKEVYVVVREPGFKYDYFNPVRVEKWGLFLAIRQEKDLVYNGSKGAKVIDFQRWESWDSAQEHIQASRKINSAVRQAKIAWPLRPLGFVVSLLLSILGFFTSPLIGLILGLISFFVMEYLANYLLLNGY